MNICLFLIDLDGGSRRPIVTEYKMYKENVQPVEIHHHVKIAMKQTNKNFGMTNTA